MIRRMTLLAFLTLALIPAAVLLSNHQASGHLAYKPKGKSLKQRERSQAKNQRHARYVASYGRGVNKRWHQKAVVWLGRELAETRHAILLRSLASPHAAICHVFGPYCSQALRVAECESGMWVGAQNGQYLGLFQMGSYARSAYGHSSTALGQARAAYRYFAASGFGWGPWACKP